ncbi:broad specificity phosphatase PhoE [Paenibacillus sp. DS2015]|uniref:histidine phosphatase family protein n=1 Tax=Paenibacillus sp. DS2015 TaxID=3373917 RepID=UPI003D1E7494
MEIILIRHGRSERSNIPNQDIHDYTNWKKEYDKLGVVESECNKFLEANNHIQRADYLFTSTLFRAYHSLTLLRAGMNETQDEIFNEVYFRPPNLKGIRLNTRWWTIVTGLCWYGGLIQDYETIEEVKNRAIIASNRLIRTAEDGVVALVGHGFINLFIYKELKRRGWKEINKYSSKNWSCTRLIL